VPSEPLLSLNRRWLQQAAGLMQRLDDAQYRDCPPARCSHRIGAQMRHILEFYECFLDGLPARQIDYDARRRNAAIETRRESGLAAIAHIVERLNSDPQLDTDARLRVRIEDAENLAGAEEDPFVVSSIRRELMTLSTHTVHHFALIAVAMEAWGLPVDPSFGVAPSTLAWRRRQGIEAA
jgi:hypothetical protein